MGSAPGCRRLHRQAVHPGSAAGRHLQAARLMPDALLVRIQGTRLALPLSGEQTIAELGPVAPLPNGEPLLLGLTTVQGRAVPLVNLAPLLPSTETGPGGAGGMPDGLMVLTDLDGDRVALLVSEVLGVTSLPTPAPSAALLIDLPGGPLLNPSALLLELRDSLER
ncbi:hypothetical protein AMD26_006400 [Deinococcus sp. UR1]|nr:hypothetical protein AMD26_006400 [Deinococcus sp. UR1]